MSESVCVEFFIKNGFGSSTMEELDDVLEGIGKQADLRAIYDNGSQFVLHNSPMMKLAVPIRFCWKCHTMVRTKRVFCSCNNPFIKCCTNCGITERMIKEVIQSGNVKNCTLECNCPDATPDNTLILNCVSWEGLICEYHMSGLCDRMIATLPSAQLLLASYCSKSKAISSLFDNNTIRLWRHIGMNKVAEEMEKLLQTPSCSPDFVGELYEPQNSVEEALFDVNSMIVNDVSGCSKDQHKDQNI